MSLFNDDYEAFVARLFAPHPEPAVRFTHAVLGLVTETYELDNATDETNAIEELGDWLFYSRAARLVLREFTGDEAFRAALPQIDLATTLLSDQITSGQVQPGELRALHINELQDDAKRWLGYGKALDTVKVLVSMAAIGAVTCAARWGEGTDEMIDEAVLANRRKLQARYDGTFTKEAALNRNLEAERHALESAGTEPS